MDDEMRVDITKLCEAELIALNRRIVDRLQLMRSAKNLTQLARFSVGGALNQKTATVITAAGGWRVSPWLLRPAPVAQGSAAQASRVVAMPRRGE
jgi:hypothetical protein